MPTTDFATLVFRGDRFNGAVMPVDVLPELAAYRMIVLSVAKALFRLENTQRERLPKGFEASFQLVLTSVSDGSAAPHIARVVSDGLLFGDVFDRARDIVEQGITDASQDRPMPNALSNEVLARFDRFGRTLIGAESIIVARPNTYVGATYDREVRHKILRRSNMSYEDNVDLFGVVREADRDSDGFELRTDNGTRVAVRTSPAFLPIAVRSLDAETPVRVRGLGLYDANGRLQKITETIDVSEAEEGDDATTSGCSIPVNAQLETLAALDDGWFDGEGVKYDGQKLAWMATLLESVARAFEIPRPFIYPNPEGLVRAEWSSNSTEIIANIDLDARSAEVIAGRVGMNAVTELNLRFDDAGSEGVFGRFVLDNLNQ